MNLKEIGTYWGKKDSSKEESNEVKEKIENAQDEIMRAALSEKDYLIYLENKESKKKRGGDDKERCVILPNNIQTYLLFMTVSNNWIYGMMGGVISLDWQTVMAKISLYHSYPEEELYELYGIRRISLIMIKGLEIIEDAAREALNARK
jgi:hypothetical protein